MQDNERLNLQKRLCDLIEKQDATSAQKKTAKEAMASLLRNPILTKVLTTLGNGVSIDG